MPPTDLAPALRDHNTLRKQLLDAFPELTDDEQTLADTLEGESRLPEQILAVIRHALEREAHAEGIDLLIGKLTERKTRLKEGARRLRSMCLNVMLDANLTKIPAPDVTLSIGKGRAAVVITDEAAIPDIFCRFKREPDKTAIGDVLKTGNPVEGASLSNSSPILTVRTA